MCVVAVSRRVVERTRRQLNEHARLIAAAVERYRSAVDHVTRFTGRYERRLAAILDSSWLTFPNALLNQSLASRGRGFGAVDARLELGNLLDVDELRDVASWKQRFWTRSEQRRALSNPFRGWQTPPLGKYLTP